MLTPRKRAGPSLPTPLCLYLYTHTHNIKLLRGFRYTLPVSFCRFSSRGWVLSSLIVHAAILDVTHNTHTHIQRASYRALKRRYTHGPWPAFFFLKKKNKIKGLAHQKLLVYPAQEGELRYIIYADVIGSNRASCDPKSRSNTHTGGSILDYTRNPRSK